MPMRVAESDSETRRIGREHSSGRECYPLMLTVGDMVKATQNRDFDPGRSAFFMPGGKGPCRFGQYQQYHRQVLDSLGLEQVPIFSPMQDETLHRDLRELDRNFVRMCWQGTLAVDLLEKMLREMRPYELLPGQADRVYSTSLDSLVRAVENRSSLPDLLGQAYAAFMQIAVAPRSKPVIGVVGEIYIRSNRFSNEGLVRQLEGLGGEARVAPVSEWLLYLTETSKTSARMNRSWKALLTAHLTAWAQQRDESRFLGRFNGALRSLHEPTIARTLQLARPYIHDSFEGEAVLSIGKAIDFINQGVSGIVNVMPLSCMPGTITSAVLKRVRETYPSLPMLNIAYEGQQDSQTLTRLEAFMHQARSSGPRS
jgi:predicted nucleotide-binding protein (sugar kinase/HSP70/actin superfamily)